MTAEGVGGRARAREQRGQSGGIGSGLAPSVPYAERLTLARRRSGGVWREESEVIRTRSGDRRQRPSEG